MLRVLRWLLAGAGLALVSCGGGGTAGAGNNSDGTVPPFNANVAPPLSANGALYGYFGTIGNQLAATSDHVNLVWCGPWFGTADHIATLQEAKARGINKAIVDLSYILFADGVYVGTEKAKAGLREYLTALGAQGLLAQLVAIYVIDEPDLNLSDTASLVAANAVVRQIISEFGLSLPLATTYTDSRGFPHLDVFDWVGCDSYGHGVCLTPLAPGQRRILITGGADPYRDLPATPDADTALVIGFVYFDYTGPDGKLHDGIGTNGMAAQYRAAGCAITGKC